MVKDSMNFIVVLILITLIITTLVYGTKSVLEYPIKEWEQNAAPIYLLNEPPVYTTVDKMINLWELDHRAANNQFAGKHVIVNGIFGGVSRFYNSDDYFIRLRSNGKWISDPIYVRLSSENIHTQLLELSKYTPGDPITVDGVLQGHEFYRMALINHGAIR